MSKAAQAISPEAMRSRFHEIKEQVETIEAQSAPLRAERDELVNQVDSRVKELEAQYLELEKPLFDLKSEMGAIARFLKGKTSAVADEQIASDE